MAEKQMTDIYMQLGSLQNSVKTLEDEVKHIREDRHNINNLVHQHEFHIKRLFEDLEHKFDDFNTKFMDKFSTQNEIIKSIKKSLELHSHVLDGFKKKSYIGFGIFLAVTAIFQFVTPILIKLWF